MANMSLHQRRVLIGFVFFGVLDGFGMFWHVLACFGLFGVFRVVFEISRLWTSMGGLSLSGDSSGMQWLVTCEGFLMGCLGFHFIVEIWGF